MPLKLKKQARPRARAVLEDEMAVEQHGLHFGQEVEVAVQVAPAGLHHADFRVGEVMDRARQEIGGRDEIGVEDGDKFAGGGFQPFLQRAGLETFAVGAVVIFDGMPDVAVLSQSARRTDGCRRSNRREPESAAAPADIRS